MLTKQIQVINRLGLHARPADAVTQTASRFACNITLAKGDTEVNAKSILGVMMLAAEYGSTLTLICDGDDEKEAATAISALFENKFNEEF